MWQKSGRMSQNMPQDVYMRIQLSGYHPSIQNAQTELLRDIGSVDQAFVRALPGRVGCPNKKGGA
jgi:hypothetical protein